MQAMCSNSSDASSQMYLLFGSNRLEYLTLPADDAHINKLKAALILLNRAVCMLNTAYSIIY